MVELTGIGSIEVFVASCRRRGNICDTHDALVNYCSAISIPLTFVDCGDNDTATTTDMLEYTVLVQCLLGQPTVAQPSLSATRQRTTPALRHKLLDRMVQYESLVNDIPTPMRSRGRPHSIMNWLYSIRSAISARLRSVTHFCRENIGWARHFNCFR